MNIPTAEEFVMKGHLRVEDDEQKDSLAKSHIEFAKIHVEAALKEASEKGKIQEDFYNEDNFSLNELKELADEGYPRKDNYGEIYAVDIVSIDKDSILNAYPLENII